VISRRAFQIPLFFQIPAIFQITSIFPFSVLYQGDLPKS
jgi:hypothetical protein